MITATETAVLVGAPYGAEYGVTPQVAGLSLPALVSSAQWIGEGYDLTGLALAAADTDGDGFEEFVVGRPQYDATTRRTAAGCS